jgi:4-amino-4-deoxy-L-arabinose transferase-like glycosyltransferase
MKKVFCRMFAWCSGRERLALFAAALLARAVFAPISDMNHHSDEPALKAAEGAYHMHRGEGYAEHWHDFVYPWTHEARQERFISYGELDGLHRSELEIPPRPLLSHPPGYSLLMWAFLALGFKSFFPAFAAQAVLDCLVPVLLYPVVSAHLGRAAAWGGGLVYALYPPMMAASVTVHPDAVLPFLSAVLVWLHDTALRTSSWRHWTSLGAVAGLACYFRPNFLAYPAIAFALSLLMKRGFLRSAAHAGIVVAVMVAALLPWAAYNHQRMGVWMFTTTSGGTIFQGLGSDPSNPWGASMSDEKTREYLAGIGLEWHSPEADEHLREKFFSAVREHPLTYAGVVLKRVPRALWLKSFWGIAHAYTEKGYGSHYRTAYGTWKGLLVYFQENRKAVVSRVLIVMAWAAEAVFLVFAYAGAFLAFRREGVKTAALLAPALCLMLSCVMVSVESRFILPGTVAYSYFAWLAFAALVDWREERRRLKA